MCLQAHQLKIQSAFGTIFQDLLTILSAESAELQDSELGHENENSMFWMKGRGFLESTLPDDLPVGFQSHDTTFRQVNCYCSSYHP